MNGGSIARVLAFWSGLRRGILFNCSHAVPRVKSDKLMGSLSFSAHGVVVRVHEASEYRSGSLPCRCLTGRAAGGARRGSPQEYGSDGDFVSTSGRKSA